MCNFGRRHHEEQFSEIIWNLDHWFSRRYTELRRAVGNVSGMYKKNLSRQYSAAPL